ncbi:MAG: fibronectin type III domain-containing protein [Solirubrobacteraceae bacterium]|nr:fibronectin type III domain-containing protein [Solirubrobacteraceae bacterium]
MSLTSHQARKFAFAGLAAAAALGSAASSAQAAKLTLNYQCKYPLIGAQPLKIDIDAAIPTSIGVGEETDRFVINALATAGGSTSGAMQLIKAASIEGTATAASTIKLPGGGSLPLKVPITVANWNKTGATVPNPLLLDAQGSTPSLTFDDLGSASVTVDAIALNLTARNAQGQAIPLPPVTTNIDGQAVTPSDSDPGTFDVYCKLAGNQNTTLATFQVNNGTSPSSDTTPPSQPGNLRGTSNANTTSLTWNAATDNVGVIAYDVFRGTTRVATVNKTSVTIPGLTPNSSSQYSVSARDAGGNTTASGSINISNPAGGVATNANAIYSADLNGTATMKTLITGGLPLQGGIVADFKLSDGTFSADLNLIPRTGRLTALGFLPVTARVGFINATKTTGNITNGVLTSVSRLRIQLLDVKLFGAISIAGGRNCQTKQISTITLRSGQNFDPIAGGAISGTFSISDLNDCGFLTGIVSPLTAGGGNGINAVLKPKL